MKIAAAKKRFAWVLPVILAFIIPVAALSLIFIIKEIYPFGDEMYLRSDMYHQYAAFLKEFQRILKGDKSLFYSWNIGLGSGFASTYSYYLASPFYWFIVFVPASLITTFMDALVVLKAGLMSASFVFYLNKKFDGNPLLSVPFGVFYSMSAYMAAYSWNLMWLDCLVLLPIIMLGLERLVRENKVVLYTVALTASIFINYYISVMICIFLIMYFVYILICENELTGSVTYFKKTGRFALYSILAGLMAAVIIVPTIFLMGYTGSMENSFPTSIYAYQSLLETLAKAVICVEPTMMSGHFPNIYCTIAAFLLVPVYWLNGKIRLKERIGKTLLLAIFLFSFTYNIPAYIWHGFHYPNSLPARHSFIYILLILIISYEALIRIKQSRLPVLLIVWLVSSISVAVLYLIYPDDYYGIIVMFGNIFALAVYALVFVLLKSAPVRNGFFAGLFIFMAVCEAVINTSITGYATTSYSAYHDDNDDILNVLKTIEDDDGFYRVEKISHRTKNDGSWLDYMSASIFSSATNSGVKRFYSAFGLQASLNSISYYGHTPVVNAIFGIEYDISRDILNDPLMTEYSSYNNIHLYKTDYALSIAYLVKDSAEEDFFEDSDDPFVVQNSFVNATCGTENVFIIQDPSLGIDSEITLADSGHTYIYLSEDVDSAEVRVVRNGEDVLKKTYGSLSHRYILDLGELNSGDIIFVSSGDDNESSGLSFYAAVFDYEAFFEWYEEIADGQMIIDEFDDCFVKGTVTVSKNSTLLTSIPYDKSWKVYVDGEETKTSAFADAFLEVELTKGKHTVEFKYFPDGLIIGIIISFLALIIFIISAIINRLIRKSAVRLR